MYYNDDKETIPMVLKMYQEIDSYIKTAILNPNDRLMVNWFMFQDIINPDVGFAQ